ncbi:MAG: nitrate ABC transporter substrate-binding protein, partial [Gammaproteobacteria bacterium]|nr:nitrate ABC transporter substrate-binding protein [Gammaproteobacteria bacterium]
MTHHLKGVLIILVLGIAGILAARFILPQFQDQLQRSTSDAAGVKGQIRIGMDNWIGYFPLCSAEMSRRMRAQGYALNCEDDQADYAERYRRLAKGELQFAVGTVDSYLLNGVASDFPGALIAVLDESKGGDAIVARRDALANLSALQGRTDLKIAYTANSPSEQLLKSINEHFDLQLYGPNRAWQLPSEGSSDALDRLLKGQAQVAVLWEPDVSRALAEPGIGKLIGTEDTDRLIVDVLLVERRFSREQPELVELLLRTYFDSLRQYLSQPEQLLAEVREKTGLGAEQVELMLRGVRWSNLNDNGLNWFGLAPALQQE